MKKSKRFFSLAIATALCCSSMASVCANAFVYTPFNNDIGYILERYSRIENHDAFEWVEHTSYSDWYVNENGIRIVNNEANFISLNTPNNIDLDDFWETVHETIPEATGSFLVPETDFANHEILPCSIYRYKNVISDEEYNIDISDNQARLLYESLKEKGYVESFKFCINRCSVGVVDCAYPTAYSINKKKQLEAYVTENELDCSIIEVEEDDIFWENIGCHGGWSKAVCLVPNYELTTIEHYELANQIARDTGLSPLAIYVTSSNNGGAVIDISGAVDGDVNEDNELSMADAVRIMQSIANPDNYALTAQGRFNGDVSNTGDGITAQDALVIQRRLLGLE